jgi:hypothetical protein
MTNVLTNEKIQQKFEDFHQKNYPVGNLTKVNGAYINAETIFQFSIYKDMLIKMNQDVKKTDDDIFIIVIQTSYGLVTWQFPNGYETLESAKKDAIQKRAYYSFPQTEAFIFQMVSRIDKVAVAEEAKKTYLKNPEVIADPFKQL